jgi:hypothetical protein
MIFLPTKEGKNKGFDSFLCIESKEKKKNRKYIFLGQTLTLLGHFVKWSSKSLKARYTWTYNDLKL